MKTIKKVLNHIKDKKVYYGIGAIILVIVVGVTIGVYVQQKKETGLFDDEEGFIVQGFIEAKEVSINSKIPGRIKKIYVEENQEVKAGDKLVEISSDEIMAKKAQAEAALQQAEAGLEAAQAQLEQAQAGVEASQGLVNQAQAGVEAAEGKLEEAKAGLNASKKQQEVAAAVNEKAQNGAREQEIAQAQAAYDVMKATYDRVSVLVEKGAVSQQKLDEIKAQLDIAEQTLSMAKEGAREEDKKAAQATNEMAEAAVTASQTRVDQAEAGVVAAKAQLSQATAALQASNALLYQAQAGVEVRKAQVEQAKAALQEVEAYLNDTVIVAPQDGIVTVINAEEGELVSTGTSIATVSNIKGAWVEVSVKETDLGKIKENQEVEIKVPAYPDKVFKGKVSSINKQPDFAVKRATNENGDFDIVSFGVKIKIENDEQILRPGLTAFVKF
ncbi:HlyD family secretion protein [Defluviitalea phaphyphila]|uniref:HlyD family secretion protein n=1 Tax=Defluviitalea phaphyphila TaxID=1473580 RepID=UPI000730BA4B|nr:efflux RND transporter periplasmic adaptor subunit [Defluviitalea phaphyphila]